MSDQKCTKDDESFSPDNIMEYMRKEKESALEQAASLKTQIINELKKMGAAKAVVNYDGVGDSGSVEYVIIYDKDSKEMVFPKDPAITIKEKSSKFTSGKWVTGTVDRTVDLNTALEEMGYQALEGHHPGWEINEGSYGELQIDVEKEAATLMHNVRITDVEYYEEEI